MNACPFHSQLNAYHDDELSAVDRQAFDAHLNQCADCRQRLMAIRQLSGLFQGFKERAAMAPPLVPAELSGFHRAVDRADRLDPGFLRAASVLLTLAASVILVSTVWLLEVPATQATPRPAVAAAPTWERVAMTLQSDPPLDAQPQSQYADSEMTDWMVDALGAGGR